MFFVSWRVQFFSNLGKHLSAVSNLCSARCFEFLQFIRRAWLFHQLTPPSRSRHRFSWRAATSTLYTTFHREAVLKTALELLDTASRFDSSTTILNPLVGTNSLYGKRTVGFSRLTRPCEARARKTLTARFTDFFTDFEKKADCFAV